ncbi:hypothetical protein SmJEL517_g02037 [Synchytrium microbalum]|uniref:Radical SAM core domain-containing protein n=1 Tax=Synchytrium microbalum TaxID=1806994 RepID=A0A507CD83_9FUNG|nr:uncharacterized protein SmJEL517_g02037 [Synchytrium microbalum]TPX35515.1 hypothetical protein SmJEL517_g02037 [Synchytrium microbalum]
MKKRIRDADAPQSIFDEEAVLNAFTDHKIPHSNARRLWRLIIQQGCANYHELPDSDLSKAAKKVLDSRFSICTSQIVKRTDSSDGTTSKLLIRLQDGLHVESVIMRLYLPFSLVVDNIPNKLKQTFRYGASEMENFPEDERDKSRQAAIKESGREFRSNARATLCVSSQVGCAMGCTFCATGTMGLVSNLTAGEILEQLYLANKIEKIRNVVFMGMGEPLDNYDAVIASIKAMVDQGQFCLSPSKISISTVGILPKMKSLINDAPKVGLALSLHAPTQKLRMQIVPTAKAYNIDRILDAADAFVNHQNLSLPGNSRRRVVLVEYVLIANVNDSEPVANDLGRLLAGRNVLLNVLPYNETNVPHNYKRPSREVANQFVAITRSHGVWTILRQSLGNDAAAACGQLVVEQCATTDMEDFGSATKDTTKKPTLQKMRQDKVVKHKEFNSKIINTAAFVVVSAGLLLLLRRLTKA